MAKEIIKGMIDLCKSPLTWVLTVGVISDLGYTFNITATNAIERLGIIIADIISIFIR